MFYYTIYKTTNLINGKIYIGKHQTNNLDDGYIGSGKHLRHSIKKYGIENFVKEILYVFDTEVEMNAKEKELVTEEFCMRKNTYNICEGGRGGFGYINSNNLNKNNYLTSHTYELNKKRSNTLKKYRENLSIEEKQRISDKISNKKKIYYNNHTGPWFGKNLSNEHKDKISKAAKNRLLDPTKNSQFGTIWITDKQKNKKIQKTENIPEGWSRGRIRTGII